MPQKIKRVGKWKIGDMVFKEPAELEALGIQGRPTRDFHTIVSFSGDRKRAHVRGSLGALYWIEVECLREYGHHLWRCGPDGYK